MARRGGRRYTTGMDSPFRRAPLRTRAIELLKEGHSADDLHWRFVGEGENPEEVRAVLTELVALQHQAAAMDPKRLRGEAKWMLLRGASIDDVVAHFVRVGVAEAPAREEAAKLQAAVRAMRPCQRCGTPTEPSELVMDTGGFSICGGCNLRDEIGRSEQRGMARELEMVGALGGGVGGMLLASAVSESLANHSPSTQAPFCARCRQPSGVHVRAFAPADRQRLDPTAEWACRLCGAKIA